jgi:hypothetical protein
MKVQSFLKGRKPGLFVNFDKFPCSWIRARISIRIQDSQMNADLDPQHCILTSLCCKILEAQLRISIPNTVQIRISNTFPRGFLLLNTICVVRFSKQSFN